MQIQASRLKTSAHTRVTTPAFVRAESGRGQVVREGSATMEVGGEANIQELSLSLAYREFRASGVSAARGSNLGLRMPSAALGDRSSSSFWPGAAEAGAPSARESPRAPTIALPAGGSETACLEFPEHGSGSAGGLRRPRADSGGAGLVLLLSPRQCGRDEGSGGWGERKAGVRTLFAPARVQAAGRAQLHTAFHSSTLILLS